MILGSLIPSHSIADWVLGHIDMFLVWIGIGHSQTWEQVIYFLLVLACSVGIGWVLRCLILWVVRSLVKVHETKAGEELLRMHTLTKCSHVIPPLVFLAFVPFAFAQESWILKVIIRVGVAYTIIMIGYGLSAVLKYIFMRYNEKENTKNLPLRGVLNIAIGIVWLVVAIVCVSVILDKSPAGVLGGLTAFAAVLMLIFKDTIQGFVAGIQMSQNDMLRVGDWIVVKNTEADGVVEDVSLSTVKVRNFDNTIVMVPPYTLVSTSFRNWRGMSESGVRRIATSFYVDPATVRAMDSTWLSSLEGEFPELKEFAAGLGDSTERCSGGTTPWNGSVESNLGAFRAYLVKYLSTNVHVSTEWMLMVRVTDPVPEGVPLQIYCFANSTEWPVYEGIRSLLMEHVMSTAPKFGLSLFSPAEITVDGDQSRQGRTETAG